VRWNRTLINHYTHYLCFILDARQRCSTSLPLFSFRCTSKAQRIIVLSFRRFTHPLCALCRCLHWIATSSAYVSTLTCSLLNGSAVNFYASGSSAADICNRTQVICIEASDLPIRACLCLSYFYPSKPSASSHVVY